MKTILVPTDFSAHATNALNWAAELNKLVEGRIVVFHSYHVPVPATDIPIDTTAEAELKKSSLRSLQELKTGMSADYPGMTVIVETSSGFADDEIIARIRKGECDYVVMGTQGSSGLKEALLGSNTSTVIEKASCPVFTIPEDCKWKEINEILFAADYGMHNYKNAIEVVELARLFKASVNLLHIRSGKLDEGMEYAELEGFKNRVVEETKYEKIQFTLIDHGDVYQGLHAYMEEANPDLLVLSMRNRNFVQKLFGRSVTKKMAHHSRIPMFVLHTGN